MSGTGGVDASIALNANRPQQPNPLVQMGQYAQTAAAMRDIGVKNALAAAYQNAPIDPATGLPDQAAVTSALQRSGVGALALPDAIQSNQVMQDNAMKIARARSRAVTSSIAPMLALGDNLTDTTFLAGIHGAAYAGYPGADKLVDAIANGMPVKDPARASDPAYQAQYGAKLHQYALGLFGRDLSDGVQAQTFTPHLREINNGPSINLVNDQPMAGPVQSYGSIPTGLSGPEKVRPVQIGADAQGRPLYAPAGVYAAQHGYGPNGTQTPDMGDGSYPNVPPALRNPTAPKPSGGAAPMPSEGGGTPMDVGPGGHAYLQSRGTESASEMNSLNAAANDIPQQQSQLNAMLGDLQKFKSGANSTLFGRIKNSFVQLGLAPESWSDSLSAQENFTKMANQFLAKQAGAMGPVTNDKLALSGESGPNPLFSNLGNEGVLHIAQGNMDALSVKNQAALAAEKAAEKSGQTFNYPQWSAQFNQSFAPSAFWYSRMTPQERQTLVGGLKSPEEKADFQAKIVNAINNKWIDPATLGLPVRQNGQ